MINQISETEQHQINTEMFIGIFYANETGSGDYVQQAIMLKGLRPSGW